MRAPDTTCTTIEPVLAAYALGERDEAAHALVEAHLATCAACRATLAAHQATARLIGLAAADAAPRRELRAQVIDAVAAAARGVQARPAPRRGHQPARLWPALSMLALVAVLIWNIGLQTSLATERSAQQQQTAGLIALLQSPNLERYPLVFDAPAPNAQAHLSFARDQPVATLAAEGLPRLPTGQVYQLWLRRDGKPTNGGTFVVDATGNAVVIVQATQPLSAYDAVGVTVEPGGGSSGPTTPRIMGCKLT